MLHYHLDLAASVRTVIQSCEMFRDLSQIGIVSIHARFDEIYVVCYTYLEFSINNNDRTSE